jgi:hypothetical protein
MISANRKMFATNKLETKGIKTTSAPAGHFGNLLAKLRKMVLGF